MFSSGEACIEYSVRLRWPNGFLCSRCYGRKGWRRNADTFRCALCARDVSVTSGTLFHQSHLPLRVWFQIMWDMVSQKQGVSALGLSHSLGLKSHKTMEQALRKLRRAMIRPDRDCLKGCVEIDEIIVGGLRRGKPGRSSTTRAMALVAVEDKGKEGMGRIRLRVLPDAAADMIEKNLKVMVESDCIIRSDGWRGYQRLESLGYTHRVVKQSDVGPRGDTTPLVHRVASLLKRWILNTYQGSVSPHHLQEYLDEFTFRFNRRRSRSRGLLFYRLVTHAFAIKSPSIRFRS